jgi:4-amino-4-deoxy-L-arabinose transferase-like glycosyltransferase
VSIPEFIKEHASTVQSGVVPHRRTWSKPATLTIAALGLFTFVVSLVVASSLFPHQSVNNDEAVYTFQAQTIADGHLTLPAAPHADFFRPWMSGAHDGRQVLVFQPIFPATLAVSDRIFGTMRIVPALIAAGCVILVAAFARETLESQRTAVIAAALFALSPFAIIHGALYLEYLYAALLELATILLVLYGRRLGTRGHLVGAGATLGFLFFMRPFDAILIGVALGVYLLVEDRHSVSRLWRTFLYGAAGALPFLVLCFAYNMYATGHALRFPLWIIGGSNGFGFGQRYIVTGAPPMNVTVGKAFEALQVNLRSFPHWFAGSYLAVPLGLWALWALRSRRIMVLFIAIGVAFPLGYLFYWGNVLIMYGRKFFGPHYYLALLAPACVLVAHGIGQLLDHRRQVGYVAFAALLGATAVELPDKFDHNNQATEVARAETAEIKRVVTDEAIVLLPSSKDGAFVLHPRGWLQNAPDLSGRVLYAADRGGENVDLFRRFPDRSVYRLQETEGPVRGSPYRPNVKRLGVRDVDGPFVARVAASNQTGEAVAVLYAALAHKRDPVVYDRVSCVIDRASTLGATYTAKVTVDAGAVTLPCPDGPVRMTLPADAGTIGLGIAVGPSEDPRKANLFEYRMWFRSDGQRNISVVTPAEQWRRDPGMRWCVTDGNPAIDVTVG